MRWFLLPFCFYLVFCTAVQLNDPDWKIWLFIYAFPTALCLWSTFFPSLFSGARVHLSKLACFALFCIAASAQNSTTWITIAMASSEYVLNGLARFATNNMISDALEKKGFWNQIAFQIARDETFREQFGLIIAAFIVLWSGKFNSSYLHRGLKFFIGLFLCVALFSAPKAMNLSGDHCGGALSVPLPSIFSNKMC